MFTLAVPDLRGTGGSSTLTKNIHSACASDSFWHSLLHSFALQFLCLYCFLSFQITKMLSTLYFKKLRETSLNFVVGSWEAQVLGGGPYAFRETPLQPWFWVEPWSQSRPSNPWFGWGSHPIRGSLWTLLGCWAGAVFSCLEGAVCVHEA